MPSLNATNNILTGTLGCLGLGLLIFWIAVAVWAYRDVRLRTRQRWVPVLSFLIVLLLPVLGLVLYLLLRPRLTLIEQYDRALEQEALLQQIEEQSHCAGCGRVSDERWLVCPHCQTQLREPCPNCNSPLHHEWPVCPYCGYDRGYTADHESLDSVEVESVTTGVATSSKQAPVSEVDEEPPASG